LVHVLARAEPMDLKSILFCLLFSTVLLGRSQEIWTLDQCVDHAIEHNLELKNTVFEKNSSQESYRQSIRDLLPSVSGSTDYTIRYGRSADPNTNDYVNSDFYSNNYSLGASLDLFRGFQKLNSIRATKFIL